MSGDARRRRFDSVEVVVIAALAFVVALAIPARPRYTSAPEIDQFAKTYGPERSSQFGEEWLIRDFFQDRRGGVFVDIGANHYRRNSTTWYLESELGWSGIAVDPLAGFAQDYATHRPRTKFLPFFVSDASNEQARMYVLEDRSLVTSSDKSFTERYGTNPKEMTAPTITMNDLLDGAGVRTFDFLSMDIELAEPKALAGFDIGRFRPSLVCIEVHTEVRQQILNYFARHQYVVVGKYLKADDHNLYFAPIASMTPHETLAKRQDGHR